MIITRLNGGLGNQMFQYALGRKLSLKNKDVLKLDKSAYIPPYSLTRPYDLGHFNIVENIATPAEIKRLKLPWGPISKLWRAFKIKILRQFNIKFIPAVLNQTGNLYLSGFWQDERYFIDIADTIRQDFSPREKLSPAAEELKQKINSSPVPISLHVRRGDYLQSSYWNTCPPDYYTRALELITSLVTNPQFFVFSDEIQWAKEHLKLPGNTVYVSNPNLQPWEELHLMSLCHHHIIANSSFSWWGAWLNPRPDKIVIAPAVWFAGTNQKDHADTVPKSWTKI